MEPPKINKFMIIKGGLKRLYCHLCVHDNHDIRMLSVSSQLTSFNAVQTSYRSIFHDDKTDSGAYHRLKHLLLPVFGPHAFSVTVRFPFFIVYNEHNIFLSFAV